MNKKIRTTIALLAATLGVSAMSLGTAGVASAKQFNGLALGHGSQASCNTFAAVISGLSEAAAATDNNKTYNDIKDAEMGAFKAAHQEGCVMY